MNGGHSASAMLLASPSLKVHSFDIMHWNYSWPVANLLSTAFGSRFELHPGNSRSTVPSWQADLMAAPGQDGRVAPCDMLLVDGDHSFAGAVADLRHLRPLAAHGAPVVVDDIATAPGAALKSLERSGVLLVRENFGPYDPPSAFNRCLRTYNRGVMCLPWGFSVVSYV
jgi:cephalosporin hydroxylase